MGMPGMSHGGGAENQPQKPSNQATPQAPSMPSMDHSKMDHSKHQGGKKAPKKDEPMDHSKHQMKPEQNNHD